MGCTASQDVAHENNAQNGNGSQRQGRPLVLSPNYRHGSHITQHEIDRQRAEFWNTRTSGIAYIWAAIKSAAEAMLSNDLALASAILEASNIMSANGTLELCYDERGNRYKVPLYCYAHALELREAPSSSSNRKPGERPLKKENSGPVPDKPITMKVRISPGDVSLNIKMPNVGVTISELKTEILVQHQAKLPSETGPPPTEEHIRIFLMGKELKAHQRLMDCGVDDKKVIQIFMRP